MLGAIKRRWKSKKAKVLHKGTTVNLSTSTDNGPTTRGAFVEIGEDINDKTGTKPPSPRQIHPISELTEVKLCTFDSNQLQSPNRNKKSSTLPPSPMAADQQGSEKSVQKKHGPCPASFIHVNSGRIELVSKENSSSCQGSAWKSTVIGSNVSTLLGVATRGNDSTTTTTEKLRRLSGRLKNDSRHSWCGSGVRQQQQQHPDQQHNGFRPKINQGSPGPGRLLGPIQLSGSSSGDKKCLKLSSTMEENRNESSMNSEDLHRTLRLRTILLEDRLRVMEGLTGNLANCRIMDKNEYEKCMTELTTQVSRAVTLQQMMKSEVEKLSSRVVELESHNNTIASMIIPTLMKLEETIGNTIPKKVSLIGQDAATNYDNRIAQNKNNRRPTPEIREHSSAGAGKNFKKSKIDNCHIPGSRPNGSSRDSSPKSCNPNKNSKQLPEKSRLSSRESRESSRESGEKSKSNSDEKVQLLSGRLSPLSKSESSSISRSKSNNGKLVGGNKKSFTYSGIPRMFNTNNTLSSPSPPKIVATTTKSCPLYASSSSPSPVKRSITNSPVRDNYSSSPANSRLPILKKANLGNLKKNFDLKSKSEASTSSKAGDVNSIVLHVEEDVVPAMLGGSGIKDEGYSTMSSEALAEQETGPTLVIGKAEVVSGLEKSKRSQIQNPSLAIMKKSNTVNSFLPIYSSSNKSPSKVGVNHGSPSESRKLMMLRDAERRHVLRNVRNCDDGMMLMTTTSSLPLPTTSTRHSQNKAKDYYDDDDDDEQNPADPDDDSNVTSTILWEDSDDSDILFLPLEMSSEDASNSSCTLVPLTSMSDQSSNNYYSTTTTTNSTLSGHHEQQQQQQHYPLRRTKGEEFVALLSSKLVHHQRNSNSMVAGPEPEEIEERVLIEKWMKLEDRRNQVQWEEEWAWDWDGVERTKRNPVKYHHDQVKIVPDAQLKTSTITTKTPCKILHDIGSSRTFTRDVVEKSISSSIDSSTWTKSKAANMMAKKQIPIETSPNKSRQCQDIESDGEEEKLNRVLDELELVNDDDGSLIKLGDNEVEVIDNSSPPAIEFTPEYYHLVNLSKNFESSFSPSRIDVQEMNGQMDDKISQTDFDSCSLENLSISSELFTECRNCLELIKRLVGPGNESDQGEASCMNTLDRRAATDNSELETDVGEPTTWVSVPKGVSNTEVNRILEILSSSESEDVLSPSK